MFQAIIMLQEKDAAQFDDIYAGTWDQLSGDTGQS